jgi:hypothetical protein
MFQTTNQPEMVSGQFCSKANLIWRFFQIFPSNPVMKNDLSCQGALAEGRDQCITSDQYQYTLWCSFRIWIPCFSLQLFEMAIANHKFESQFFDMVWCDFFEWGMCLISRGYFFCLPIQLNTFWKLDQLHRTKITKPSPTKSQGMVATKPALVMQSPSKIVPRKNHTRGSPVD